MKLDLSNKLTILRLFIALSILVLLGVNWSSFNVVWPMYLIGGKVVLRLNYLISFGLFLLEYLIYIIDIWSIRKKKNNNNEVNIFLDDLVSKVLIDSILVILAYNHDISLIIPIAIIISDIVIYNIKANSSGKINYNDNSITNKIKSVFMFLGISILLIENVPMEFFSIALDQLIIIIACCISIYISVDCYLSNKDIMFDKNM